MRVAVFGGSGFIGSHVADELTSRGYGVRIFDMRESAYLKKGQEMVIGDLLDEAAVRKAIKGCDYVYHFAGIADIDAAAARPLETIKQNILGSTILLNESAAAKVKRFIYASTIYVYSSFGGFYRCSKQAVEAYIEEYQRTRGLDFTVLRYGTVYGPRSDERNSIYRYLQDALHKEKIVCHATGDEMREYVHVRDVAALTVDVLDDKFRNQYVNITGQHPTKFKDMLYTISEMLGNKVEIEFKSPIKESMHYSMTPYSFAPKIGRKLVSNYYTDLGQGLLELLEELQRKKR